MEMETKPLRHDQGKNASRRSKENTVEDLAKGALGSKMKKILQLFSAPSTPRDVEKALGIRKIKMKPYLEKGLIFPLNSSGRKGRLYTLTPKARKILSLEVKEIYREADWNLIGWIKASPKQRLNLLKTMAIDYYKRTSEEIRLRAAILNPRFTRISTKQVLKELYSKGLIETEVIGRKRYYWISKKGKALIISFDF